MIFRFSALEMLGWSGRSVFFFILSFFVCLSVCLSFSLSVYLSLFFIFLSVRLSVFLSVCWSLFIYIPEQDPSWQRTGRTWPLSFSASPFPPLQPLPREYIMLMRVVMIWSFFLACRNCFSIFQGYILSSLPPTHWKALKPQQMRF